MIEPTPPPPSDPAPGEQPGGARPTAWSRLSGARVPQLLGVYAGASFAVLQVADIFVVRLGLPDWTFFSLVLVLLAGAPLTVATALVQSAAEGLRARSVLTWRNTALGGVGAVVALALTAGLWAGSRALGVGPAGSLMAAGVLEREEAILIADFQSQTGDQLLASAITEAFRIDFEQSPVVRVVAPGAVRDALVRMQRPPESPLTPELARELALREGIKAVLLGEINRAGSGSIISVRLVAPGSEDALVAFRETVGDSTGVIPALDRLSNRVRERIGESLRTIRAGEPLERVSTASLLALRHYSQGVRAIDRDQDFTAGIALLEEAIAQDSTFAMAWRKLGVTLQNQGENRERWEEAFTRAYELSDRLTERERYLTRAGYYAAVAQDSDRAIAQYRSLLELHPTDGTALNNLAVQYVQREDRRTAMELYRRALASDSSTVIYYTNLLGQELALGEHEAARRTFSGLERRFPELPVVPRWGVQLAWATGDFEDAEAALLELTGHPRSSPSDLQDAAWGLAALSALRGRVADGRRRVEEVAEIRTRFGMPVGPGHGVPHTVNVRLHVLRDTSGARELVEETLSEGGIPDEAAWEGAHLTAGGFFLQIGEVERGRRFVEEWDRITGGGEVPRWLETRRADVEALLALVDGRPEAALRHHRQEVARGTLPRPHLYALAEIFRRTGEADSTLVYLERSLAAPAEPQGDFEALMLPSMLESLGDLHWERGERELARPYYLRFAELWRNADPELQPRVRRARERAGEAAGSEPGSP